MCVVRNNTINLRSVFLKTKTTTLPTLPARSLPKIYFFFCETCSGFWETCADLSMFVLRWNYLIHTCWEDRSVTSNLKKTLFLIKSRVMPKKKVFVARNLKDSLRRMPMCRLSENATEVRGQRAVLQPVHLWEILTATASQRCPQVYSRPCSSAVLKSTSTDFGGGGLVQAVLERPWGRCWAPRFTTTSFDVCLICTLMSAQGTPLINWRARQLLAWSNNTRAHTRTHTHYPCVCVCKRFWSR